MKYFFNYSVSGEVDDQTDSGKPDTVPEIQKVILESFPHDLLAGVQVKSVHISVNEQIQMPKDAGMAQVSQGPRY